MLKLTAFYLKHLANSLFFCVSAIKLMHLLTRQKETSCL
nr:MAG TPA: hypothetical protein [Caudoviricetes sp.]